MIKEQVSDYLNYLNYEKKYSSHTLRAYTKDLNDFIIFIKKESIKSLRDIKKQHIHQFLPEHHLPYPHCSKQPQLPCLTDHYLLHLLFFCGPSNERHY